MKLARKHEQDEAAEGLLQEEDGLADSADPLEIPESLSSIGDASASLGLVSTLVFGAAVGIVMEHDDLSQLPFVSLAIATSTYTTTFSLLEYYYITTMQSIVSLVRTKAKIRAAAAASTGNPEDGGGLVHSPTIRRLEHRMQFALQIEEAFASFNEMRMFARNSMWISLMSIVAQVLSAFLENVPYGEPFELTSSWKASRFFVQLSLAFGMGLILGFRSRDLQAYCVLSVLAAALSTCAAIFLDARLQVMQMCSALMLLIGATFVPVTVRSFRSVFLAVVKENSSIW